MTKFGKKFTCWKCGAKFYDLNKPGAKCPKCASDPADDPNRGAVAAPPPSFGSELVEEPDDEVVEEAGDEDEAEDEHLEDDAAPDDEF